MPIRPITPPAPTSAAQIIRTMWKASTDSWLGANVSPTSVPATTTPMTETAIRPATRAIALLMAEAMPASCSSASARMAAVSGATVIESPIEKTISGGSRSTTYDGVVSVRGISSRMPAAATSGPRPMKRRGP